MARTLGAAVAAFLALAVGGCASAVRTASETAVPIVVSSGLGELATERSQAQLKSIAASPAVQEAGYGVGLGIGRGMSDEVMAFMGGDGSKGDEPPPAVGVAAVRNGDAPPTANAPTTRKLGVAPTSGPATTQAAGSGGGGGGGGHESKAARSVEFLQANLTPAVSSVVRSAVTAGMGEAMGPQGRAQIHDMAVTAGDGLVSGMSRAAERDAVPMLSRVLRDRLEPALEDLIRHRLGPALHEELDKQVAPVIRQLVADCARDTLKMPTRQENANDVIANARNVSVGASLGTHDALIEMGLLDQGGRWSWWLRASLWGGAGLLALVTLAALVLLVLRILIAWGEWRRIRRA